MLNDSDTEDANDSLYLFLEPILNLHLSKLKVVMLSTTTA